MEQNKEEKMEQKEKWCKATKALHAGYRPGTTDMNLFKSYTPPLIQSAIYPLEDIDQYTRIIEDQEPVK